MKTRLNANDVITILGRAGKGKMALAMLSPELSGIIGTYVATIAEGLANPKQAEGLDHQLTHDWRNEFPGLEEWVRNHPEKFVKKDDQ